MIHIYILQLETNKFFVGITDNIIFNITHFDRNSSSFTKKYKPLFLLEFKEKMEHIDIDITVKKYMNKYGIDSVRGGSYLDLELSIEQKNILQGELWTINNKCYKCGGNHLFKECNSIKKIDKKDNYIFMNTKNNKTPVIIQNYIWFWSCCICNKNSVGAKKCSDFNFAITSPTYLDNNGEIKKIAVCDICIDKFTLFDFANPKKLIDLDNKEYDIKGFEKGQYQELLNCV